VLAWAGVFLIQALLIGVLLIHRRRRQAVESALRASEERYREVLESQAEMVCRYQPDTTLTFVNEAYCRYFGKRREDLLGTTFLSLIPTETHAMVKATVQLLVTKRRPTAQEHEVLRPDGTIGWMRWDDYAILDERGEIEELQGIGRDITEQHLAEEALRQSEEKFSRAFHASPSAISIHLETDGRIVDVNEAWQQMFQIQRKEAAGRTPLELGLYFDDEERERFRRTLNGAKSLRNHEMSLKSKTGEARWVSLSCDLIQISGDSCYISILHDITERKRIEEIRQEMAQSARLAMVGELTASIAHEINQPLGAILSNAEAAEMLLESGSTGVDEVKKILADIVKDDLRASEVIRHVRALVGKRTVPIAPVDLGGVVMDVTRVIAVDAHRRGMRFACEVDESLPAIQGDRVQLEQLLLNLMLNGMDAMEDTAAEERKLVIRVFANHGAWVEVSIRDCGHGIARERLPRLFESFFTTKANGMGLGLALARSIAESHRGHITAENNADGGATFRLRLPVERGDNPNAR
jgi:PAS domain S-box-containing protein